MKASTIQATLITLAAAGLTTTAFAGDRKPSIGFRVGEFIRDVDGGLQRELDRRPQVRQRITGGINTFADNAIDAVTPEADEDARRLQRNAVQMMLNPSRTESDRAFQDLQEGVRESLGRRSSDVPNNSGRHRPAQVASRSEVSRPHPRQPTHIGRPSAATTSPRPGVSADRPAAHHASVPLLQAAWHGSLWERIDSGLVSAADTAHGKLPRWHQDLTAWLASWHLGADVSATLASSLMVLAALFGLYLLFLRPRRRLARRIRQLRLELALARREHAR